MTQTWRLLRRSKSFKVTEFGTNRKLNRGRGWWPLTNSFLLLRVLTSVPILVKIDQEMRPWECSQTDTLTDWLTDTNRFYTLSHAKCYSCGTDNNDKDDDDDDDGCPRSVWMKSKQWNYRDVNFHEISSHWKVHYKFRWKFQRKFHEIHTLHRPRYRTTSM